jgi:glucose/arabinose dehydrogenase
MRTHLATFCILACGVSAIAAELPRPIASGLKNPESVCIGPGGEVGQNIFEEINIIKRGGNYGWSVRESLHPFGAKGVDVRSDLIEPIWEYHHDVGKSITGGHVYRGKQFPELNGAYLYADYVTSRVWALWFDEAKGRVVANREIKGPVLPIVSFGEDAAGETFLMTISETGRNIHRLVKAD